MSGTNFAAIYTLSKTPSFKPLCKAYRSKAATCIAPSLCAKMFINADVEHIVFDSVYPDERAMTFFDEAHIAVV